MFSRLLNFIVIEVQLSKTMALSGALLQLILGTQSYGNDERENMAFEPILEHRKFNFTSGETK